jgi:hypothetical protein
MTTPFPDDDAPPADENTDDDWFGEGSVFESGEGLAAALMALAGGGVAAVEFEPVAREPRRPAGSLGGPPPEFQVSPMPSAVAAGSLRQRGPAPSRWFQRTNDTARAQRTGWAIRQSVKTLKMTEDMISRLREEAMEVSWRAAGSAMVRSEVKPTRRIRREIKARAGQ